NNVLFRNLKHIDVSAFISDALDIPWHTIWTLPNVDEKILLLNKFILELYDKHAPLKTKLVKRLPAPWITTDIRNIMANRDIAYLNTKYKRHITWCTMIINN
ncbi:hypothetical protein C0J52_25727, partial [Blattella germanica]